MICRDCGERRGQADLCCVMSDDGEGPHRWERRLQATAEDAAFIRRVDVHHEQGGMEQ